MKVGDRIAAKVKFKVDGIVGEIFAITFVNGLQWKIPIHISGLGIRPEPIDFCSPGEHNYSGHPDYYKRLYIDQNRFAVYDYYGARVRLEWGTEEFHLKGKYSLIDIDSSKRTDKYAQKRTAKDRNEVATSYVGTTIDGEVLIGTIINIFVRENVVFPEASQINVVSYDSIEECTDDAYSPFELEDIRVVIHDDGSYAEYELPAVVCGLI